MEREWAALITLFGFGGFLATFGLIGKFLHNRTLREERERREREAATPPAHP